MLAQFKVGKFEVKVTLSEQVQNNMIAFFKSQFKVDQIPDSDFEGSEGDCYIVKKGTDINIELQSLQF